MIGAYYCRYHLEYIILLHVSNFAVDRSSSDGESGSIFWFSVPIRGPVSLPIESVQMVDENLSDGIRDLEVEGTKKPDVSNAMVISSPLCNIDMDHLTSAEAARARARANNTMVDMRMSECASIEKPPMKRKSNYSEDSYSTAAKMPQDLSSEEESQPLKKRSKCALVIDDSKTIRKVIDRALKNFGFDVVLAENGLQGLEEMKTTVFDIVLCDFLMPIMDGMDCVQQYRQWESSHRAWFKQVRIVLNQNALVPRKQCANVIHSYFCTFHSTLSVFLPMQMTMMVIVV